MRLRLLPFGPCRHMDAAIGSMVARNAVQDVVFFELDIDEQHAIAQRFGAGSIPFFASITTALG